MTEQHLEALISDNEPLMNFQSVVKIDKFGKKKIDRTICLTTHHILIVYEGVLDLELKSRLEIRYLSFIIKNQSNPNEIMLLFSNK